MIRMNLGCGPDIKEDWVNVDTRIAQGIEYWDARNVLPKNWEEQFDFILINHVLCTMIPSDVDLVLKNVLKALKPGGVVQIIEMDMLKAYEDYYKFNAINLPIFDDHDPDYKLTMHVSGYGTRLSLYTPNRLWTLFKKHGFSGARILQSSEYDLRPSESTIVEGIK